MFTGNMKIEPKKSKVYRTLNHIKLISQSEKLPTHGVYHQKIGYYLSNEKWEVLK